VRELSHSQLDWRKAAELGLVSADGIHRLDEQIENSLNAVAVRFEAPRGRASIGYTFSEQILFLTGRPVLFVPTEGTFATLGRHIAVAWNSSRPAARSLNDALPLIERAEKTTVLMIDPSGSIDVHAGPPAAHMVEHLRRHGAAAEAIRMENIPHGAIADKLLATAHAHGADLIVAGAFGHPRLWEKMLGGVRATSSRA
jgi:nucleotide-binding universal stress UspA family protein